MLCSSDQSFSSRSSFPISALFNQQVCANASGMEHIFFWFNVMQVVHNTWIFSVVERVLFGYSSSYQSLYAGHSVGHHEIVPVLNVLTEKARSSVHFR